MPLPPLASTSISSHYVSQNFAVSPIPEQVQSISNRARLKKVFFYKHFFPERLVLFAFSQNAMYLKAENFACLDEAMQVKHTFLSFLHLPRPIDWLAAFQAGSGINLQGFIAVNSLVEVDNKAKFSH